MWLLLLKLCLWLLKLRREWLLRLLPWMFSSVFALPESNGVSLFVKLVLPFKGQSRNIILILLPAASCGVQGGLLCLFPLEVFPQG